MVIEVKEKTIDRIMKISMRLLDKFRDELFAEYGSDIESIDKMFDALYKEQNEIMPLMWYKYGFTFGENFKNIQEDARND